MGCCMHGLSGAVRCCLGLACRRSHQLTSQHLRLHVALQEMTLTQQLAEQKQEYSAEILQLEAKLQEAKQALETGQEYCCCCPCLLA